MSKIVEVNIDGQTVAVRKLPLGKYAEFLKIIEVFSKDIGDLLDKDNDYFKSNTKMVEALLPVFMKAPPEFCKLLSLVSDKDENFYSELGLDDALDVLVAALEVNDYNAIVEKIKKVAAQIATRKPAQPGKAQ